ncbi:MAG: ribosome silencing factor [candidate division Zixibacteria bacterium]|nr:ribosome silencing factor [candidate division Zixibacteria bacterium]
MKQQQSAELAHRIAQIAYDKKGFDVKILNLQNLSSVCDYFVIVSGAVDTQVKAIAEAINDGLREEGIRPYHIEGMNEGNWILLDYIDVVVHVFREPTRQFYALEKLWGDAPIEALTEE